VFFDKFKSLGYDFTKIKNPCVHCLNPIADFEDLRLDECLQSLLKKFLENQTCDASFKLNMRDKKLERIDSV
jgi:ribosome assembly protein YihI (activator of Der GTPase)